MQQTSGSNDDFSELVQDFSKLKQKLTEEVSKTETLSSDLIKAQSERDIHAANLKLAQQKVADFEAKCN